MDGDEGASNGSRTPAGPLVGEQPGATGAPVGSSPGVTRPRLLRIVPEPTFSVVKSRKIWLGNGRAHIEVRGGRHPDAKQLMRDVEKAVGSVSGVKWAKTIAMIGQLVVAFEGEGADLEELFDSVDSLEAAHEVDAYGHEVVHREHPSDSSAVRRNLFLLGADAIGLVVSPLAWMMDVVPFLAEAASLVTVAETSERVRRFVDRKLGTPGIFGLATIGSVAQGVTQGPLGLVVDAGHRVATVAEIRSRNGAWERREHELTTRVHELPDVEHDHLRPGAHRGVERFADLVAVGSLASSVAAGVATRSPRRAACVMLAGIPKAALRGHEAFASEMARRMADRGAIVMDYTAFRLLDRVDTVVVEEPANVQADDVQAITALVDAARRAGLRTVVASRTRRSPAHGGNGSSDARPVGPFGADERAAGGLSLATSIRTLQAEGATVLLVSSGHHNVFRDADTSIGILHEEHHVPWGADVIVGPGFSEAAAIVSACGGARWVTRVGIGLSTAATAAGVAAAITSPLPSAVRLSVLPVNSAALVSMGWAFAAASVAGRRYRPAGLPG